MSKKLMIVEEDCGWCPSWMEKFKDKIETNELKVVNLTDSQEYIDLVTDLEIDELPSIVEIFDDGNACLLDDEDWNKIKRCKNDRCNLGTRGKDPVEI